MVDVNEIADRIAIEDVICSLAASLDLKDWSQYRTVFADNVLFDYSSHSGRPAAEMSADTWTERLSSARPNFDVTQHSLSNFRCEILGDTAKARTYLRAEHFLASAGENPQATLGGYYDMEFRREPTGWKITVCRLIVTWKTGNADLYALAFAGSERAS